MKTLRFSTLAFVLLTIHLGSPIASASTIAVGVGAFGAGSTLTTFNSLASGLEVNGLTVDGILFQYSLGNGQVVIDGGPGTTNNITPMNVVSVGNNTGVLTLILPSLIDTFGYGYALLNTVAIPNATTISLFNGATPIGSLSYAAAPDPTFSGGFAGIQSTILFNRVQLTFNSATAPAFALDNVRTASPIPEPATLVLVGLGAAGMMRARSRRKLS